MAEGQVARTYGGAIAPDGFNERSFREKEAEARSAKVAIAAAAMEFVPDTGAIFIDGGTTCAALARLVANRSGLHVFTRGLEIALILAGRPDLEVTLVGGRVLPLSHGLVGPLASYCLSRTYFDVVFLSADGVHPRRGIGQPTIEEVAVKEEAAAHGRRTVVLAHASKLSGVGPPVWTQFPPGWLVVTDDDIDKRVVADYEKAGVEVKVAAVEHAHLSAIDAG
jgi:DeoR/GlpR family transcriptional regulator of sugar metabolism